MMQKTSHLKLELLLIFIFSAFICLANIWGFPITILDEAKNTEAAREMLNAHALIPLFNDFLRTDKPPLHYFFMQIGYLIFGVNEIGARFFGAILGAGFMTYFYSFLYKNISPKEAKLSSLILLSSAFWVQEFHLAVPDPYLIVFLCTAWLLFFTFYKNHKKKYLWLFYVLIGLATLSKGPVAIGLTGLIVISFLLIKREFNLKKIWSFNPLLGGFIVILIAAPWFIWIHEQTNGAFTDGFFIKHNIQRFSHKMEGHGGIFLITWLFVILGLFPFGAFIPHGLWFGWKKLKKNDLYAYAFVISLVVIVFFSISGTKLPNYTLPGMPFLALLVGGYLFNLKEQKKLKNWQNTLALILISIVSFAIPVAVYLLFKHPLLINYQIATTIVFTISIIGFIGYIWHSYTIKKDNSWIYSIALLWIFIALSIFYYIYPKLSLITPVVQAKQWIEKNEVVVYKTYDPAFNINYQRNFKVFKTAEELNQYINNHPNTLVLSKNKTIEKELIFNKEYKIIFKEASVFENYKTVILKYNSK